MYLPNIPQIKRKQYSIRNFYGLNEQPEISVNEFSDMHNMSNREFPVLSSREKNMRILLRKSEYEMFSISQNTTFFYNGEWGFVDGESGDLYYGSGKVAEEVFDTETATAEKRSAVNMGAYVLFYPDKIWFNTADLSHGHMNINISIGSSQSERASVTLCFDDGIAVGKVTQGKPSSNISDNDVYYKLLTSNEVEAYRYHSSGAPEKWEPVTSFWYKISKSDILPDDIKIGDYIELVDEHPTNPYYSGFHDVADIGTGYITIEAPPFLNSLTAKKENKSDYFYGKVRRTIPDMDFIIESNNRIWGCSSANHEIYASALGRPLDWNVFDGEIADSYAATVGSDGEFTGAVNYLGYPCFFKEDQLIKVYGSRPSNFQFSFSSINGVRSGAWRTLCTVADRLYYAGRNGIYVYAGGEPVLISGNLGGKEFNCAGFYRDRYYIADNNNVYVYYPDHGTFCREFDVPSGVSKYFVSESFCTLFAYGDPSNTSLIAVGTSNAAMQIPYSSESVPEAAIDWSFETKDICSDDLNMKRVCMFQLQASGSGTITVKARYDNKGGWRSIFYGELSSLNAHTYRIIPRRCEYVKLRIYGTGEVKIHGLNYYTER